MKWGSMALVQIDVKKKKRKKKRWTSPGDHTDEE